MEVTGLIREIESYLVKDLVIPIKLWPDISAMSPLRVNPVFADVSDHSEFESGKFYVFILFAHDYLLHCLVVKKLEKFDENVNVQDNDNYYQRVGTSRIKWYYDFDISQLDEYFIKTTIILV
jgi:hypothetical protein